MGTKVTINDIPVLPKPKNPALEIFGMVWVILIIALLLGLLIKGIIWSWNFIKF